MIEVKTILGICVNDQGALFCTGNSFLIFTPAARKKMTEAINGL